MPLTKLPLEELVTLQIDGERLDGRLAYSEDREPSCAVLITGSHPLLGGDMNNNVVSALRLGLAEYGAAVLSFDYRHPTDDDEGQAKWSQLMSEFWKTSHVNLESNWCADAGAALRYLKAHLSCPVVLIGYSFGCKPLADWSSRSEAAALVCVSPNPPDHDLAGLSALAAPLLVVSSDNDFSCPPESLHKWFDSLSGQKELRVLPSAEHFFRGHEATVVQIVAQFLRSFRLLGDRHASP